MKTVWNVISSLPNDTLGGISYYYVGIYIQQSDDSLLPSTNSSWYVHSGNFIIRQLSSSSTVSTLLPTTTLNTIEPTNTVSGPAAASSTGAGTRKAVDQFGWGVIGFMGVLAIR